MGLFTDHPHSVGESYREHFKVATGVGSKMIIGGLACCIHGFLPFAFLTTGSRTIRALYERLSHGARHKVMHNTTADGTTYTETVIEYSI